jgi:hypothetical protein
MLTINIDNPELEQSIKQAYGDDKQTLANAFMEFIQQKRIKQDIDISIQQLDAGEGIPMEDVMKDIKAKYEK